MENNVHNFSLNIDWKLIRLISQIDRFDASWTSIEKKEGQSLKIERLNKKEGDKVNLKLY